MGIGEEIRKLRQQLGLTQAEFADRIGVTTRALQRYEAGARQPEPAALLGLLCAAAQAGVPASEFASAFERALGLDKSKVRLVLVSRGDGAVTEVERRRRLLEEYKRMTGASECAIYSAAGRDHSCHKPEFYAWKRGELSAESKTARSLERFLAAKQPPSPLKREEIGEVPSLPPKFPRNSPELPSIFPRKLCQTIGMTKRECETKWVKDTEAAALLGLSPGTLRNWRTEDIKAGRVWPQPGRGGLRWRKFGGAVRYLLTPELLGEAESELR